MTAVAPRVPRTKPHLPHPLVEAWQWQSEAACRDHAVEEFFVADRLPGDPRAPRGTSDAKEVCTHCPVREQCLEHALSVPERFGVWGGLSARERERVLTARNGAVRRPAAHHRDSEGPGPVSAEHPARGGGFGAETG